MQTRSSPVDVKPCTCILVASPTNDDQSCVNVSVLHMGTMMVPGNRVPNVKKGYRYTFHVGLTWYTYYYTG